MTELRMPHQRRTAPHSQPIVLPNMGASRENLLGGPRLPSYREDNRGRGASVRRRDNQGDIAAKGFTMSITHVDAWPWGYANHCFGRFLKVFVG